MKKSCMKTVPLASGSEKALEISDFFGLYDGKDQSGMLLDCNNVHVHSGGAIASLLAERRIDVTAHTPNLTPGVYTYYNRYDPTYELPTTAEWVYENVCPADVLQYADGMTAASRLLIADVGCPAKTEKGYRKVHSACSDGDKLYVLYEAVYNVVDQRRVDQLDAVGEGIVVAFDSRTNTDEGTFTKVCTLTQVFLDVIAADGSVETSLLTAWLEEQKTLDLKYAKSTLISTDKKNFRYVTPDYIPTIGGGYSANFDRVYTDIYPNLATAYKVSAYVPVAAERLVRYRNRKAGAAPYGNAGEKLLLLPDMRLLQRVDGGWQLAPPSDSIPRMQAAAQHAERLFGIDGDRIYASAMGNCSDFTEAVQNLPADGAWQSVTADAGGFTALAPFDGKVVAFTRQSMITVRGSELPLTVAFEGSFGCNGPSALAAVGEWLYFVGAEGIFRYNGSRTEAIGRALPRGIRFAEAELCAANGFVLVHFPDFTGLYLFDPISESWSRICGGKQPQKLIGNAPAVLFDEGRDSVPYLLFGEPGNFSFSVSLAGGGRRRVRSISVTARLSAGADLQIRDATGRLLFQLQTDRAKTCTRTCLVRGCYLQDGFLSFAGTGEVTLHRLRIGYLPIRSAARAIG